MKRLPPEWEPHEAVLFAWPHEKTDWVTILEEVHQVYHAIFDCLLGYTNIVLTVPPCAIDNVKRKLENRFSNKPKMITVVPLESNDTWARDHGPICVESNARFEVCDFIFNGWGNKFPSSLDNKINAGLYHHGLFPSSIYRDIPIVLEGGAIESDGNGTVMTTSQCLLNQNRNPGLDKTRIENILAENLGAKNVLWLDYGYLAGDDTDSHIDTLARFSPDNVITYVSCDDSSDEHFEELKNMEHQLKSFRNARGQPYTLIPLPWPEAKYDEGDRLPATYANFLVSNGAVLVPTYEDANDELALSQLNKAFPNHAVVGINCSALIKQHGSLHCITMQLPCGV